MQTNQSADGQPLWQSWVTAEVGIGPMSSFTDRPRLVELSWYLVRVYQITGRPILSVSERI